MRGKTEGITDLEAPALEPVVLEVVDGPHRPPALELAVGSVTVGSDPSAQLHIDDPSVSRSHARLELLAGSVRVVDLGSTNGTRYLGARINEAKVPIGGEVQLGRSTVRIRPRRAEALSDKSELGDLRGRSPAMRRLYAQLEKLAASDASVLITGETGSGKGAVARALHGISSRAKQPWVVFDCAAVNPNLIEAALFGHVKGAFTGADANRVGALEQALDGTLLLDEVGELPLELQPKLLRALDAREFSRVGEHVKRTVKCRFFSATHRDLEAEVKRGGFRADLYFRLAQTVVHVPPLRDRREDVPALAQHFAGRSQLTLSPATIAALQAEPWRGNVRELENAVARALTLGEFRSDRGPAAPSENFSEVREEVVRRFERDYLEALLEKHGRNLSAAARASGLARSHLYRLLERHQLRAVEE
ncbi:MAG: sigma 54-dependent Fis family transcriptional regulator [Myxococcaceae bacterium]|nr:sigma 54-dependent Fis family transcriptional regulator [Myxococcaceae bacterium]